MITCREDLHNTWVDVTKDHGVVKLFAAIYDKDALFGNEIIKPYDEVGDTDCVAISVDSRGGWAKHVYKPFHPTLREVTMSDFTPSNDVKYYDKDEEIKPQDGFVSNAIKDFKVSHKLKTEEELMSDNSALDKAVKEVMEKTHNKIMSAMPRVKTEYVKLNKNDKDGKFWEVARDFSESNGITLYFIVDDSYLPVVSNERLLAEYKCDNLYRKVGMTELSKILSGVAHANIGSKLIGLTPMHHCDFATVCRLVVEGIDKK